MMDQGSKLMPSFFLPALIFFPNSTCPMFANQIYCASFDVMLVFSIQYNPFWMPIFSLNCFFVPPMGISHLLFDITPFGCLFFHSSVFSSLQWGYLIFYSM